jgi:SOS-response transcriptional repressor LexA
MKKKHEDIPGFCRRLHEALDKRGYPSIEGGRVAYLQEIFKVSRGGAYKWVYAKAMPNRDKREEIAQKLGISFRWLESGVGNMEDKDNNLFKFSTALAHEVPLLTLKEAYDWKKFIEKTELTVKIVVGGEISNKAFAIKQVGKSMSPKFEDGDILIIEPALAYEEGDYVLCKVSNFKEALVRQWFLGSEGFYITPIHKKFESINADDGVEVIGVIVQSKED